jgi:hypothetical protein
MHPLSYYIESEVSTDLMSHHGCYLQNATDQQLRELLSCYAAAMCSARETDVEAVLICQALTVYLHDRAINPRISRSSVPGGESWVSS